MDLLQDVPPAVGIGSPWKRSAPARRTPTSAKSATARTPMQERRTEKGLNAMLRRVSSRSTPVRVVWAVSSTRPCATLVVTSTRSPQGTGCWMCTVPPTWVIVWTGAAFAGEAESAVALRIPAARSVSMFFMALLPSAT
mgnify:CR=1 FL=1